MSAGKEDILSHLNRENHEPFREKAPVRVSSFGKGRGSGF